MTIKKHSYIFILIYNCLQDFVKFIKYYIINGNLCFIFLIILLLSE